MKKIVCTVTNDLNFDQRMIRICTALSNAGYLVLLVGRLLPHSPSLIDQPFQQKRFNLIFTKGKLFYLEYNFRLFLFLLFIKFDAICSVDLDTLLPGFIVAKLKRKICIYDAHEYFTEVPELTERPMIKGVWEYLANLVIPKLKHCYTVCESIADEFLNKYKTHFSVIRNVPFKKYKLENTGKKESPFILVYQGVLNEGRGLEELISVMEELNNVELWLAGEGDLSGELRNLVRKKDLADKVIFYGRVSPGELHRLTCLAHLGLNLLKNKGLNYYYSLANKTFDYMQAGIPSICMDFPEYSKINEQFNSFFLLRTLNKVEIIGAVNQFIENKSYYMEMCKNSINAGEVFIWEKEEKKLIEFYNNIFRE